MTLTTGTEEVEVVSETGDTESVTLMEDDDGPNKETPSSPDAMCIDDKSQSSDSQDDIQILSFSVAGKVVSPQQFSQRSAIPTFDGIISPNASVKVESPRMPDAVLPFVEGRQKRALDCDAVLIVGTQRVPVHQSVLVGYSKYFKGLCDPKEKRAPTDLMLRLTLDVPESTVLSTLVKHMYAGGNAISLQEANNLIPASTMLQIDYLTESYIKIIAKDMNCSNCLDVVLLAARSKNTKLRELAETMIKENLEDLLCSTTFLNFSLDTMIQLIEKDTLTFPTEIINRLVDTWLAYQDRQSNIAIFTQLKTVQIFRNQDKREFSIFDGQPDDFKLETSESYTPGWVFLSSLITPKAARHAISPISLSNLNKLGEQIKVKLLDDEIIPRDPRLNSPSETGLDNRRKRKFPGIDDKIASEYKYATSIPSLPQIPKRPRQSVSIETQTETQDSWDLSESFSNRGSGRGGRGNFRGGFNNNNNRGRGGGFRGGNNRDSFGSGQRSFGCYQSSFGGSNSNLNTSSTVADDDDWDAPSQNNSTSKPAAPTPKQVDEDDWDTPPSQNNFASKPVTPTKKQVDDDWDSVATTTDTHGRGGGGFQGNNRGSFGSAQRSFGSSQDGYGGSNRGNSRGGRGNFRGGFNNNNNNRGRGGGGFRGGNNRDSFGSGQRSFGSYQSSFGGSNSNLNTSSTVADDDDWDAPSQNNTTSKSAAPTPKQVDEDDWDTPPSQNNFASKPVTPTKKQVDDDWDSVATTTDTHGRGGGGYQGNNRGSFGSGQRSSGSYQDSYGGSNRGSSRGGRGNFRGGFNNNNNRGRGGGGGGFRGGNNRDSFGSGQRSFGSYQSSFGGSNSNLNTSSTVADDDDWDAPSQNNSTSKPATSTPKQVDDDWDAPPSQNSFASKPVTSTKKQVDDDWDAVATPISTTSKPSASSASKSKDDDDDWD